MTPTKIKKELTTALEKFGNLEVFQRIDYWYRETYEGDTNWKVREVITIQDLLDNPDCAPDIWGYDFRNLVKDLRKGPGAFPIKVPTEYADSRERYNQQRAEHPKEEREKAESFQALLTMANDYRLRL